MWLPYMSPITLNPQLNKQGELLDCLNDLVTGETRYIENVQGIRLYIMSLWHIWAQQIIFCNWKCKNYKKIYMYLEMWLFKP